MISLKARSPPTFLQWLLPPPPCCCDGHVMQGAPIRSHHRQQLEQQQSRTDPPPCSVQTPVLLSPSPTGDNSDGGLFSLKADGVFRHSFS